MGFSPGCFFQPTAKHQKAPSFEFFEKLQQRIVINLTLRGLIKDRIAAEFPGQPQEAVGSSNFFTLLDLQTIEIVLFNNLNEHFFVITNINYLNPLTTGVENECLLREEATFCPGKKQLLTTFVKNQFMTRYLIFRPTFFSFF